MLFTKKNTFCSESYIVYTSVSECLNVESTDGRSY